MQSFAREFLLTAAEVKHEPVGISVIFSAIKTRFIQSHGAKIQKNIEIKHIEAHFFTHYFKC